MSMSLIVSGIEEQYNVAYIANTFWNLNIAKVRKISLTSKGLAYVELNHWCDSEVAYNFIRRINNLKKETRLVHYQDDWWIVKKGINNCDDFDCVETVTFDDNYFEKRFNQYRNKIGECETEKPIKSIRNYNYTIEEALNELNKLRKMVIKVKKNAAFTENILDEKKLISSLIKEYIHLENELAIHRSVCSSDNVTIRKKRRNKL
jgi:hypothetical protein